MRNLVDKLCPMRTKPEMDDDFIAEEFCLCRGDDCAWYIDRNDYQGCAIAMPRG